MSGPGDRPTVAFIPPSCCGAGYFRPLRRALGDRVTVRAVELPGHGRRFAEPRLVRAADAVADLDSRIGDDVDVVYGESLGAYVALAVLDARGHARGGPVLVAASNSPPSTQDPSTAPPATATAEEAVATLRAMGGEVPPEVLDDPELTRQVVPLIRDDLRLGHSLARSLHRTTLAGHVVALTGTGDRSIRAPADWARHTTGAFSVLELPGGHLLSATAPAAVADAVVAAAARSRPPAGAPRPSRGDRS